MGGLHNLISLSDKDTERHFSFSIFISVITSNLFLSLSNALCVYNQSLSFLLTLFREEMREFIPLIFWVMPPCIIY